LNFWEAWVFLIVFFVLVLLITLYFLKRDPDLIERRLKAGHSAEKRTSQKVIQLLASLFWGLCVLIPGFDHRFHWSHVAPFLVMAADVVVLFRFVMGLERTGYIVQLYWMVNHLMEGTGE